MNDLISSIKNSCIRVFNELGSGHNEKIYHKALKYELDCLGICSDMERHINVCYQDSKGNKHCIETERRFVCFQKIQKYTVELKAISRGIQEPEKLQIGNILKRKKRGIDLVRNCVNFPQPTSKDVREIDFEIIFGQLTNFHLFISTFENFVFPFTLLMMHHYSV